MHKHVWTDFDHQIAFVSSDIPEGLLRIVIGDDHGESEARLTQEEFESLVIQIREKMGW